LATSRNLIAAPFYGRAAGRKTGSPLTRLPLFLAGAP
jgi:hypothetical protein